jgi:hypothetical protein
MRIERVTDISEIMKCLPFEREIRNKGRDDQHEGKMLLFVQSQLGNPSFGFFMVYDDENEVIGYSVAMLSFMPGHERLHLLRIYAKQKEAFNMIEETLKDWARPFKIKIAQMIVTGAKQIKAFQRRFGYKVVSVNMERRYL